MEAYIETRVLDIASYIIETGATVRAAAKEFGVSKSTVHKDMTDRLKSLNRSMAKDVAAVLETNKEERHLRGGYATYLKYRGGDNVKGA
ncbi:MAG: sporulation transcriptional regulator SpoIIID [Clostridia bacterium]|nr:sporulation transcriptional regulator SpoIIID [Clostridia bacterium]